MIGVCAGFIHSSKLSFIAQYAVDPSYQRQGIGKSLWDKTMQQFGNGNVSLIASPKMISIYRDLGFKFIGESKLNVYTGIPNLNNINNTFDCCSIEIITNDNVNDVIEYDESVCGLNRTEYLRLSIAEPECVSLLARCNDKIAGYVICRTTNFNSITPRPLYADNDNVAEILTYNCINKHSISSNGMYLEVMIADNTANCIADKLGLNKIMNELPFLSTREDVKPNKPNKIYFGSTDFYPF